MLGCITVEEVDRLRLRVDDPDLILYRVVADVSNLLTADGYSLEALLPYHCSVESVCPEVSTYLSSDEKHIVLVPSDTLDTAVAVVSSFLNTEDLDSLLVLRCLHNTYPVALATHIEVAGSRVDCDCLHIKRLLELLLYLTLEADLRKHALVTDTPEVCTVLADAKS